MPRFDFPCTGGVKCDCWGPKEAPGEPADIGRIGKLGPGGNCCHGYQNLSVVFALLMMLAFLVDQVQQLCCPLFQAAWVKMGSKRRLWERMRALFYDYALESMRQLLEALFYGLKKPAPVFAVDTS